MGAQESKLLFRKQIASLTEELPTTEDYFKQFYTSPDSAEDVFNLCTHKEIREVLEKRPENIGILLEKLTKRILEFIELDTQSKDDSMQCLNCIRLITRIMPFIFERDQELEKKLFWTEKTFEFSGEKKTLGSWLVKAVTQLLFCRGFTIPQSLAKDSTKIQYIVWNKGIGAASAPPASKDEILNRIEVLRLMQVFLAKAMYTSPNDSSENTWAMEFIVKLDRKVVLGMMCSFINTIIEYDPIGWASLPYNHLFFGDVSEPLVKLCAQSLICLFGVRSPNLNLRSSFMSTSGSTESIASLSNVELPPSSSNNSFWTNNFSFYFSKLYKPSDFQMLVDGITRLLRNPIDASKAYLPGSTKKVNMVSIMILLLWTLTEANPKFLSFLCSTDQVLTVLCSIIIESLDARMNPKLVGNLRMSCFLLHVLSQERNFGIHLNASLDLASLGHHAKTFPTFSTGCWGDAVYLFIFILLSTPSPSRSAINLLQESYLSTIANIAPLITKFNPSTAQKLFSMFSIYSSPRYLLAKSRNNSKLFYLLYTIDTILQYQYHGNVQIVYTFVRNKDKVLALRDMTFDLAVEAAKKGSKPDATPISTTLPGSPSLSPQASEVAIPNTLSRRSSNLSDKAKGKLPMTAESEIFEPTPEWFDEWKSRLPLQVLTTLVETLSPKLEQFVARHDLNVDTKVLVYLAEQTMVGVLPQPHPIITHSFIYTKSMQSWVNAYIWGTIYTQSLETTNAEVAKLCPSIYGGTKVKLFGIASDE